MVSRFGQEGTYLETSEVYPSRKQGLAILTNACLMLSHPIRSIIGWIPSGLAAVCGQNSCRTLTFYTRIISD